MKKLLIVSFTAVIVLSLMGSVALAGGWTTINYSASHDPNDLTGAGGTATVGGTFSPGNGEAIWNPNEASVTAAPQRSPHGFFSTTSNKCRVCHAVHMAGTGSWRLLRDGETSGTNGWSEDRGKDRLSECNYCHGATGATLKRPFRPKDYDSYGEHTLSSTQIPDSSGTTSISGGLSCGNCHTVHGSNSLANYGNGIQTAFNATYTWTNKILRSDPNGDKNNTGGGALAQSTDAWGEATLEDMTATATGAWATLSNFCGDCHNVNPNWDANASDDGSLTAAADRPNKRSHAQGPAADGSLEVYGANVTVANWGNIPDALGNNNSEVLGQNTQRGCRGCHAASAAGNESDGMWNDGVNTTGTAAEGSAWPHQTQGAKLLFDTFTGGTKETSAQTFFSVTAPNNPNDALRVLPGMDKLCMRCHRGNADASSNATDGVGISF